MLLHQEIVEGLAIQSYLLADPSRGVAAVVDPTRDVQRYLCLLRREQLELAWILETHVHADFVTGAPELRAACPGARIACSAEGGDEWLAAHADHALHDQEVLEVGALRLRVLHTPGHTPEQIALTVADRSRSDDPWLLLSGDCLFVGDVGRPDLLGEEQQNSLARAQYHSLFERLSDLPDHVELFPAHGGGSLCGKSIGARPSSTLGYERRHSRPLQPRPAAEWVAELIRDQPLAPSYFQRMKRLNRQGPPLLGPSWPDRRHLSPRELRDHVTARGLVVDTRSKEAFAAAHVPGSISLPLGRNFASWAGWVLPYEQPLALVLSQPSELLEVVGHLHRVGLDQVHGYLEDGLESWLAAGYPFACLGTLTVHDLRRRLGEVPKHLTVLDVRTEPEWSEGHIEGALHLHGGVLQQHLAEIPRDRPVAVICGSGYRASIAASLLRHEGYGHVSNVIGGMTAWKAAALPLASDSVPVSRP